jgi:Zn finger protein HypA/HybF involved in hydrogenase expression
MNPIRLGAGTHFARKCNLASLLTTEKTTVYPTHKKEARLVEAYCMKCRAKREMKSAKAITMKNGKPATQGTCPTCGTKMFKIGKG